jgi:hypothetical protein
LMSRVKVDMMPNDRASWVLHCCKWWLIWFTSWLVAEIHWQLRGKISCGSSPSQKKSWAALISMVTNTWKRLWNSLQSWISFALPFAIYWLEWRNSLDKRHFGVVSVQYQNSLHINWGRIRYTVLNGSLRAMMSSKGCQ